MDKQTFLSELGKRLFKEIYIEFYARSCSIYIELGSDKIFSLYNVFPELIPEDKHSISYEVVPEMPDNLGQYKKENKYKRHGADSLKTFVLNGPENIEEAISVIKSQDIKLPEISKKELLKYLNDKSLFTNWKITSSQWGLKAIPASLKENSRDFKWYFDLDSLTYYDVVYRPGRYGRGGKSTGTRYPFTKKALDKEQLLSRMATVLTINAIRSVHYSFDATEGLQKGIQKMLGNEYHRKIALSWQEKGLINPKYDSWFDTYGNLDKMGLFDSFQTFLTK